MRLKNKTAIVTGGASGFGAGIVRKFVAEGARVMIADLNGDGAESLKKELGSATLSHAVNVAKDGEVANMIEIAVQEFGHVDVCLLYTSPSPRDKRQSRMPSSA